MSGQRRLARGANTKPYISLRKIHLKNAHAYTNLKARDTYTYGCAMRADRDAACEILSGRRLDRHC